MSLPGIVVKYDRKRGFGIIKPEGDEKKKNYFIHWSNIVSSEQWPSLKGGMKVLYDLKLDDDRRGNKKEVACNVTDRDGGDISVLPDDEGKDLSKNTFRGVVKFFARQGYGFITCDSKINYKKHKVPAGSDVYVSREDVSFADDSLCTLSAGMRVQFKVCESDDQEHLRAGEVTLEGGKPIEIIPGEGDRGDKKGSKGRGSSKGKGKGNTSGKSTTSAKGKGKRSPVTARAAPWKAAKPAQKTITSANSKTTGPVRKTVIKTFQKTSQKGKGKSGKKGTR
mmetsp:Transcript_53922/g.149975  ORF Transcript_53922/g.149975 Transcript_53922/m.149975 type:complete len:280 (+) Transcript_53922:95-934(+)